LSGDGEVIEPDDDVLAIGSGGPYALAAARALLGYTDLSAEQIARAAMEIAATLCIYTNTSIIVDTIGAGDALLAGDAALAPLAKGE
jgi:ATP-dependent HslUV protease subunit HslV